MSANMSETKGIRQKWSGLGHLCLWKDDQVATIRRWKQSRAFTVINDINDRTVADNSMGCGKNKNESSGIKVTLWELPLFWSPLLTQRFPGRLEDHLSICLVISIPLPKIQRSWNIHTSLGFQGHFKTTQMVTRNTDIPTQLLQNDVIDIARISAVGAKIKKAQCSQFWRTLNKVTLI